MSLHIQKATLVSSHTTNSNGNHVATQKWEREEGKIDSLQPRSKRSSFYSPLSFLFHPTLNSTHTSPIHFHYQQHSQPRIPQKPLSQLQLQQQPERFEEKGEVMNWASHHWQTQTLLSLSFHLYAQMGVEERGKGGGESSSREGELLKQRPLWRAVGKRERERKGSLMVGARYGMMEEERIVIISAWWGGVAALPFWFGWYADFHASKRTRWTFVENFIGRGFHSNALKSENWLCF